MSTHVNITRYKTRLGIYPPIKPGQGSPVGGIRSREQARGESETPRSQCHEFNKIPKLKNQSMYAEDFVQIHAGSMVSCESCSIDSVDGVLLGSSTPLAPTIHPLPFLQSSQSYV